MLAFNNYITAMLGFSSYGDGWYNKSTDLGTGLGVLIKIGFVIYPVCFLRKINFPKKQVKLILVSLFLCATTIVLSATIDIFNRVEKIFSIGYIIALIVYIQSEKIFFRRAIVLFFMLFSFVDFNKSILNGSTDYMDTCRGARITPYVSILNKEDSTRDPHLTRYARWCDAHFEKINR